MEGTNSDRQSVVCIVIILRSSFDNDDLNDSMSIIDDTMSIIDDTMSKIDDTMSMIDDSRSVIGVCK